MRLISENKGVTSYRLYSRKSPSKKYRELVELYRTLHLEGEPNLQIPAEKTFTGQSLPRHANQIRRLIRSFGANSILDYGAGKGMQYNWRNILLPNGQQITSVSDYWGNPRIYCYDPAYPPFSKIPDDIFDGVICTDVLEHCYEGDIPWILEEIFNFAKKFVYANVASFPAQKYLPDGQNAHCTVKPAGWWKALIKSVSRAKRLTAYFIVVEERFEVSEGTYRTSQTVCASPRAFWAQKSEALKERIGFLNSL